MPMVGIGLRGDLGGERLGHGFDHHREGAGLGDGARVGDDRRPVGTVAALGAEAAERIDRLRA